MNKDMMTIQQIMTEQNCTASQKLVRRKLRAKFAASHERNERWTFKKGSREYNIVVNEILATKSKSSDA